MKKKKYAGEDERKEGMLNIGERNERELKRVREMNDKEKNE